MLMQVLKFDAIIRKHGTRIETFAIEYDDIDMIRDEIKERAGAFLRIEGDGHIRSEVVRPLRQVKGDVVMNRCRNNRFALLRLYTGKVCSWHCQSSS